MVLDSSGNCDDVGGWLREMRSAIMARVRDCNPMELAGDLAHRFWCLLAYGRPSAQNLVLCFLQPRFWPIIELSKVDAAVNR